MMRGRAKSRGLVLAIVVYSIRNAESRGVRTLASDLVAEGTASASSFLMCAEKEFPGSGE
jgi:hypothetical protein